jgi:L-prolyl-PCP dehydrogenase
MGLRTSPLGDVVLDDVFVSSDQLLGKAGRAAAVFSEVLEWERIWPMAVQVGVQLRELGETRAYAVERQSFGAPISSRQSIANRLVEMKLRIEAGRLLLYRAAALKAQGKKATSESALAKLWLSESAVQSSLDSVHVHGAYGYMSDAGVERRVRDALGSRIYSGTSEMQRNIVAHEMGL